MATKLTYTVIDDLDGSTDQVGTYRFAAEDVEYEIDLAPANLQRLRTALEPFITAARRLPKTRTTLRGAGRRSPDGPVRDWWKAHAHTTGLPAYRTYGPIPAAVRRAHAADRGA